MKTYAAKSSAVRAAIAGIAKAENRSKDEVKAEAAELFTIEQNEEGYYWRRIQKEVKAPEASITGEPIKTTARQEIERDERIAEKDLTHCPHCNIDLENGVCMHGDDVNGAPLQLKERTYACLACDGEFGPKIEEPKKKAAKTGTRVVEQTSSIEKPCDAVWRIAEEMKGAARKDVVKACEEAGVATNTARTQYQRWFTANKSK